MHQWQPGQGYTRGLQPSCFISSLLRMSVCQLGTIEVHTDRRCLEPLAQSNHKSSKVTPLLFGLEVSTMQSVESTHLVHVLLAEEVCVP